MMLTAWMAARVLLLVLLSVNTACADLPQSPPATTDNLSAGLHESAGLQWIDWMILVAYGISTIALGWYFGRRQRTTEEYFIGSGNMNSLLIGVSLFATLLSTISYLSTPGEVLGKGPVYLTYLLALPVVFLIVGYVLLPVYMHHRVTSAYELLEKRLGLSIRMLGVVMFLVMRLVWMSLLIYLAAKAMTVMMGVDEKWIPLIVLITGLISVIYTSLGGLQAVVITDLVQTILLFFGALLVLVMITVDFGCFGWFPTQWQPNWDSQPFFSFDPKTRISVVGLILSVMTWYISTAGGDQVAVQRFMATSDERAARRAYATQLIVGAVVTVTLGVVGLALLGYFQAHPEAIPANMDLTRNADKIFPHYIAYHLPVGVSGLVVAAMFAAAMSSIDSGVNSITAVVMTDLLDRFGWRPATEKGHVLAARLLALCIGGTVVVGSMYMGHIPGNITAVTSKTVNLLTPHIFSLFVFALFIPFARPAAVWLGSFCGLTTAVLIAFSGPIFGFDLETGYDPVSFLWMGPVSLAVNLTVGTLGSLVLSRGKKS